MILFLPPAPHDGSFFDVMRRKLSGIETRAANYPGYGGMPPVDVPSIEIYAASLLPVEPWTFLVGFHTGCLVALEMARQDKNIKQIILVDIPYFDAVTKAKFAAGLETDNPAHDAFRAAFAYDVENSLHTCQTDAVVIATQSALFDSTIAAAKLLPWLSLFERRDIVKPAFESPALAKLLRNLYFDALTYLD